MLIDSAYGSRGVSNIDLHLFAFVYVKGSCCQFMVNGRCFVRKKCIDDWPHHVTKKNATEPRYLMFKFADSWINKERIC